MNQRARPAWGAFRPDDARVAAAGAALALAAALWLLAASAMGAADSWLVELCRAAFTGQAVSAAPAPPLSPLLLMELWAMWALMMAAMMLPAMAAVLAPFADIAGIGARGARFWALLGAFSGGYLLVWGGFSGILAAAQLALREARLIGFDGEAAPFAAGALLLLAGAWQFSAVKQACMVKCRAPMAFLMAEWRPGAAGAARLGLRHGMHCLGCCAALMGLMFVFGAMNLWWMAAISLYCLAEKVAPGAERWGRWAGAAMLGAGAAMIGMQV